MTCPGPNPWGPGCIGGPCGGTVCPGRKEGMGGGGGDPANCCEGTTCPTLNDGCRDSWPGAGASFDLRDEMDVLREGYADGGCCCCCCC